MANIDMDILNKSIEIEKTVIEKYEESEKEVAVFDRFVVLCLEELKKYIGTGLSPDVCMNFKKFEDECIYDGVTFKQILTLKDIVKGMTCETCRDEKICAICENSNIRYCSEWNRGGSE